MAIIIIDYYFFVHHSFFLSIVRPNWVIIDEFQIGGGITVENAEQWINDGAKQVIITSWLFPDGKFKEERLRAICDEIGKNHIVIDLR